MFSLSMTSSAHVTLRSSGFGMACKCSISGGDSLCISSGAGVTVCDPVVGVPSRACIRCMISNVHCLKRNGIPLKAYLRHLHLTGIYVTFLFLRRGIILLERVKGGAGGCGYVRTCISVRAQGELGSQQGNTHYRWLQSRGNHTAAPSHVLRQLKNTFSS